jgi:hypothetical protein
LLLLAAVCSLVVSFGVKLYKADPSHCRNYRVSSCTSPGFQKSVAAVIVIYFSTAAALAAVALLQPDLAAITLDSEGLHYRGLFPGLKTLAWSTVVDISLIRRRRAPLLRLRVLDTANPAGKLRYRIVSVPVGLVAINPQVLFAECQTWVQGATHADPSSLRRQERLTLTLRQSGDCADE